MTMNAEQISAIHSITTAPANMVFKDTGEPVPVLALVSVVTAYSAMGKEELPAICAPEKRVIPLFEDEINSMTSVEGSRLDLERRQVMFIIKEAE